MKQTFTLGVLWTVLAVPLAVTAQGARSVDAGCAASRTVDTGAMSEGEVRRVDTAAGKLTLRHGPLANLDMPAMTMVFRVRDPAWLRQLDVGEKVRFVAERIDGNLTVTAFEPERQAPTARLNARADRSGGAIAKQR